MQRSVVLAAGLVVVCAVAPASAYKPVPWDPTLEGLSLPVDTPLRIARESLDVTCVRVDDRPHCTLVLRSTIENPSNDAVTATATVLGRDLDELAIEGGRASTDAELAQGDDEPRRLGHPVGSVLEISLAAKASRVIVVRARMSGLHTFSGFGEPTPPFSVRHPLLGGSAEAGYLRGAYEPVEKAPYRATKTLEVTTHVDDDLSPMSDPIPSGSLPADAALPINLDARRIEPLRGAPYVGIGSKTGDEPQLRARIGWEVPLRSWLISGVALEGDLRRRWIVAPTFEAASSGAFTVFPSFSLGAGVPVQVAPDTRVGARFVTTIHFPFVGLALSFDVYPRAGERSTTSELTVVARIGF